MKIYTLREVRYGREFILADTAEKFIRISGKELSLLSDGMRTAASQYAEYAKQFAHSIPRISQQFLAQSALAHSIVEALQSQEDETP